MNCLITKCVLLQLVICSSVICSSDFICNQTADKITRSVVQNVTQQGHEKSVMCDVKCALNDFEGMHVTWCNCKNEVIQRRQHEDWKIMALQLDSKNDFDRDGKSLIKCMAFSADNELIEIQETTLQLEGSKKDTCGPTNFTQHPEDLSENVGNDVSFTCLVKLGIKASSGDKNNSEMAPCDTENNLQVFWTTEERPNIMLCNSTHRARTTFRKIKLIDAEGCAWVKLVMQIKNLHVSDFNSANFRCEVQDKGSLQPNVKSKNANLQQEHIKKIVNYWVAIVISLSVVAFFVMFVAFIYVHRIDLLLFYKDKFLAEETNGAYDLYVCFNSEDKADCEFVANLILPYLEAKLSYKCFVLERDTEIGAWLPSVVCHKIQECRRFLLIYSENIASDPMCKLACNRAMDQAINSQSPFKLMCIYPHSLKRKQVRAKMESSLDLVFTKAIKGIELEKSDSKKMEKFWKEVRLQLPPMRSLAAGKQVHEINRCDSNTVELSELQASDSLI